MSTPTTSRFDDRFSDEGASAAAWVAVDSALGRAELYWLTTVRGDGRPHVTPLVGVWVDGTFVLTTGPGEQKHRNLEGSPLVAVTTGTNTWAAGTDVVVEGRATRVTDRARLEPWAEAFREKYGAAWDWYADDDGFRFGPDPSAEQRPWVYAVAPAKVIAFGKDPHAQTTFVF